MGGSAALRWASGWRRSCAASGALTLSSFRLGAAHPWGAGGEWLGVQEGMARRGLTWRCLLLQRVD